MLALNRCDRATREGGIASKKVVSAREAQVLGLVAEGMTDRAIGGALGLSEYTVARHIANARAKLGAANRAQAAVRLFHPDVSARPPRKARARRSSASD